MMPYDPGRRLPGERANRLGHLEVLQSPLVNKLCRSFEDSVSDDSPLQPRWEAISSGGQVLPIVFGVDGSLQVIESEIPPYKALAFVKTALLRLDQYALSLIDKDTPHPFALRDILSQAAQYHATVFPLRHVRIPGMTTYDAVRQIIFESIADRSLEGEPMETLKWLVYEKWDGNNKSLPLFACPHCGKVEATLPYNAETGTCPACGNMLFVTDMLGFQLEMSLDAAADTVATAYMNIHETLLLFTGIRYYWEHRREWLDSCLFVKDGPLTIRAQYSKLVAPIRRFLSFAREQGCVVHLIGQEKTGRFVEHLQLIGRQAPPGSLFLPASSYVTEQIQHKKAQSASYGLDTNYGTKVFVKVSDYHQMVLSIPTGEFREDPQYVDLLGADDIFATLPKLLSNRFEGALLPVELAHSVASLSTYPSASMLKMFAEQVIKAD